MGDDACRETRHEGTREGAGDEMAVAEGVERCGIGAEEAAPAHAHGGEDGDGVAVDDAALHHLGDETEGCADRSERGDGEGHQLAGLEAEEPVEQMTELAGQMRQQLRALIGFARVDDAVAVGRRNAAEGEHHDEGGDDEHAGNDGKAHFYARLASIEQGIEDADEERLSGFVGMRLVLAIHPFSINHFLLLAADDVLVQVFGMLTDHESLHESGGDDAAADGSHKAVERLGVVAVAHHEDDDEQSHGETACEVDEADVLVALEVTRELRVLRHGDDGRLVAEERHQSTGRRDARQPVERAKDRLEDALQEVHHAEDAEDAAQSGRQHAHGHEVEDGVEQQVVGCAHDGVEHVGEAHHRRQVAEEDDDDRQAGNATRYLIHLSQSSFQGCPVLASRDCRCRG